MGNLYQKNKGFSLVELLVVILIIIILASISVIALNDQRAKARDAKRISDIRQIRTALEFYFSDEGEYPIIKESIILGVVNGAEKLCSKAEGGFVAQTAECKPETTYMVKINPDPYVKQQVSYTGTNLGYDIVFTTEKESSLGPMGIYHAHSSAIDNQAGNK